MMNEGSVGARLRSLRGNKSPKEVADAINVSVSSYIKYERDERVPRDEVKTRISKYYKRSVASIFFASKSTKVDRE